jgi:hypothetical protein
MGADDSQIVTSGKFVSRGKCLGCGYSGPRSAVSSHLDKCLDKSRIEEDMVVRLCFETPHNPRYWIMSMHAPAPRLVMWTNCCAKHGWNVAAI